MPTDPKSKSQPPERLSGEQARVSGTHTAATDPSPPVEEVDLTPAQQKRIADLFSQLKAMNLYDLLGAPRLADKKAIKRAYNERAMELHPDRFFRKRLGTFKPKMEAIFARMTEAQEVLCSPERRAQYDAALQASRASLIEVMLEQAAAEMAGGAQAACREDFSMEEPVQVRSTPPLVPVPTTVRPPVSPADLEARRQTLARKLSPRPMPAVKAPADSRRLAESMGQGSVLESIDAQHLCARCAWCVRRSPPLPAPERAAEEHLATLGWIRLLRKWACPVCQKRGER